MKTFSLAIAIVALFSALLAAQSAQDSSDARPAAGSEAARGGRLYHVVSIKFKKSATKEQIKAVEDAFVALKDKIPGIASLTWGTNVSPEKHDKGFTHCFVLTFASEKDRNAYLPHPAHGAFGKVLGPVMDDVMVIDFWGQGAP
jgi:hypothetical protein